MNTIVIRKEVNGNVSVIHNNSGREHKMDASLSPFKEVNQGVVIIRNDHGQERQVFNPVDVEKVVRVNGSEVPINDVDTLYTELVQNFFFDAIAANIGIGWAGQVATRNDLPITLDNPLVGEVYLVEQPITDTILGIPYRTYQSGFYIRDTNNGNLNDWRRLNVKVQFTGSEFAIVDAARTSAQFGFDPTRITEGFKRIFTAPDRDSLLVGIDNTFLIPGNANKQYLIQFNGAGTDYALAEFDDSGKADASITITGGDSVAGGGDLTANRILTLVNDLLNPGGPRVYGTDVSGVKGYQSIPDLISNNAGQIKLNWTGLTRPESPAGFRAGVPQGIPLNVNYTVSGNPTTTFPYLADALIGGENVINPATLSLRELLAGQSIIFRVKSGYLNKGAGQNGNIIIRMFNPNPGSSLVVPKSIPTPDRTTTYEEEFEFIAIADALSLDPLYGYQFEAETTFGDGNLIVYIEEITAFYQGVEIFNKTP